MKVRVIYSTKKEIEVSDEFMPLADKNFGNPLKNRDWRILASKLDTELLKQLPEYTIIERVLSAETGEVIYEA